jgi:hypothetical protein
MNPTPSLDPNYAHYANTTPALSVQGFLNQPILENTMPKNQIPALSSLSRRPTVQEVVPDFSEYQVPQADGLDGEAGKVGGVLMDLIWPGWPPRLPTPSTSCSSSHTQS